MMNSSLIVQGPPASRGKESATPQRNRSVSSLRQSRQARVPRPLGQRVATRETNSPSKWDRLIRYMDALDSIGQVVTNFFAAKGETYRDLRSKVDSFFAKEIKEIEVMSTQWLQRVDDIKKTLKREEHAVNYRRQAFELSLDLSREKDCIESDAKAEPEYNEQKLQQIDYETSVLNHNLQKMKSIENQRETKIVSVCGQLFGTDTTIPAGSSKGNGLTQKIATKFDTFRPYDVFFLDLQSLTYTRARINNLSIPPDSAAIYVDYRYFVCGGRSDSATLQYNSTFELDAMLMRLNKVADMAVEKRNHTLASADPHAFYSFCGYNEKSGYLGTCEKYSIEEDRWMQMPDVLEKRQDPSVCPFGSRRIYLFGGGVYRDEEWAYTDDIEFIDVTEEVAGWRQVLLKENQGCSPRIYAGMAQVSDSQIIFFGGYNGTHCDDCFVLNLAENTIGALEAKLPRPSSFILRNSLPVVRNSTLYAIGASGLDLYMCSLTTEIKWKLVVRAESVARPAK